MLDMSVLNVLLDVLLLVFLGAMIFFALRLSNSLNTFRSYRQDFEGILKELVLRIDHARNAVQDLKETGSHEARELNTMISQAKALLQELKEIQGAGEGLAGRLEALAEKSVQNNRQSVSSVLQSERVSEGAVAEKGGTQRKQGLGDRDFPAFMIRDPDFEALDALEDRLEHIVSNDEGEISQDEPDHLKSQAEKELFHALRRSSVDSKGQDRGRR